MANHPYPRAARDALFFPLGILLVYALINNPQILGKNRFLGPCSVTTISIVDQARARFDQAANASRLVVADGGTLDGAGTVTVTQEFAWLGGTLAGGGTVTTDGTAFLSIAGGDKQIRDRTITITPDATGAWSGDGDIFASKAGRFNNSGTFTIENDRAIYMRPDAEYPYARFIFSNSGTLVKDAPYTRRADAPQTAHIFRGGLISSRPRP